METEIKAIYKEMDTKKFLKFIENNVFLKFGDNAEIYNETTEEYNVGIKNIGFKVIFFSGIPIDVQHLNDKEKKNFIKDEHLPIFDISIEKIEKQHNHSILTIRFQADTFETISWKDIYKIKDGRKYAIKNSERLVNFAIDLIKETKPLKLIIDYEGKGICYEGKGDRVDKDEQLRSWFSYSKKLDDFLTMAKAYQTIKEQNKQFEGSTSKILKNCAYKTFEFDEGFAVQISPTIDVHNDLEYNNFYNKIHP